MSRFSSSLRGVESLATGQDDSPWGTIRAIAQGAMLPFRAIDEGVSSAFGHPFDPEPLAQVPRVDPIPDDQRDAWREPLRQIYGESGEHWAEGVTDMMKTSDGIRRARTLRKLVEDEVGRGGAYTDRFAELEKVYGGRTRTFWTQVLDEYKEARKDDAEITRGVPVSARAAGEAALWLAPELKAISTLRKAGVPASLAGRAALTSGTGAELVGNVGRAAYGAGRAGARYLAEGAGRLGELAHVPGAGALTRAATTARAGAGAAAEARLARELAVAGKGAEGLAGLTPTYARLSRAYGVTEPLTTGLVGRSVLGASFGAAYADDPVKGAAIGAFLAGAAPPVVTRIGEATVPEFLRFGAPEFSFRPALGGALVGGLTGGAMAEDPLLGFSIGAAAGAVGAHGAKTLFEVAKTRGALGSLVTGPDGKMNALGYMATLMSPQADIPLNPALKPGWDIIEGQTQLFNDRLAERTNQLLEAVGPQINDYKWIDQKLTPVLRSLGRDGAAARTTKKVAGREFTRVADLSQFDPADVERGKQVRRFLDSIFDDMVDTGLIDAATYRDGYIPGVLDRKAFWGSVTDKELKVPKRAVAFGRRLETALQDRKALDLFREDPKGFWEFAKGESFGLDAADAARLNELKHLSGQYGVGPNTVLNILQDGEQYGPRMGIFGELYHDKDTLPVPFNEFAEEFSGSRLPMISDPIESAMRYIYRVERKRALAPLVETIEREVPKTAEELGQEAARAYSQGRSLASIKPTRTEVVTEPLLKPIHDMAKAGEIGEFETKVLTRLVKSRLGIPSKFETWVEGVVDSVFPNDPGQARDLFRTLADLQYAGALGYQPGKAVRNLFQSLLTATALDGRTFTEGMVEASRAPEYWMGKARAAGTFQAGPLKELELAGAIRPQPGLQGRIRKMAMQSMKMYEHADQRNRLWAFTAGYRKAYLDGGQVLGPADQSIFREPVHKTLEEAWAKAERAGTKEARDAFASLYGRALADLTQWVYGKSGSPLISHGPVAGNLMMFTSWPLNYVSLLRQWGKNGQSMRILRLGLAASVLDQVARDQAGITRFTGLTPFGQQQTPGIPLPLPTTPLPSFGSPLAETARAAGGMVGGALQQDYGTVRKSWHSLKWEASTLGGPPGKLVGTVARELAKEGDFDFRNTMLRLFGYTPLRNGG